MLISCFGKNSFFADLIVSRRHPPYFLARLLLFQD